MATTTATDTLQKKSADANVISGGHLAARALKNEGVDTIFTLCGGHIIDIYDGCVDEGIRIIDVRHEQVAAHAADGYARQTGKLGCVVTTAGPGCTNAMTGIACAFRAESPILHIGGQGALTQHKMGSLQDLPHVEMMAPITKLAAGVRSTERVADMIAMAARECFAGAYGPSYLEIPRDILDREIDTASAVIPEPGRYRASTRSIGDPADIERLADILVSARTPCILLGTQVWNCRGHEQAIRLVRELNIPAYFNGSGRGLLPPGDPHHFNRTRRLAFNEADVIVIVGTPFDFRMGYGKRLSREATIVQIDQDYRTVGKNRDHRDALGVEAQLHSLSQIEEHRPVVAGLHPGPHHEVHARVRQLRDGDRRGRVAQHAFVARHDLVKDRLGLGDVVVVADAKHQVDAARILRRVVRDGAPGDLPVGDGDLLVVGRCGSWSRTPVPPRPHLRRPPPRRNRRL